MSRVKIVSHSFLVQNFHEFFNLLLRQKEFALRANEGKDPVTLEQQAEKALMAEQESEEGSLTSEQETEETPPTLNQRLEQEWESPLVNTIQRRLSLLLEEQAMNSTVQTREFAVSSYQDALYAMVAFADEIFLNIPWIGQKQWENNLLESRFFQTQIAGELLFQKIENLIATNDPMRADLAVIYLLILGLGFKGKFREADANLDQLTLYRQQLYRMINRHPSTLYDPGRDHLIQDCYDHVLDSTISKGLPEIRMWLLVFVGILGTYLFASTILWYKLVRDMDSSIGGILHQAHQMGLS
ncbi:MAG: type secretion protein DotU [Alphaproteobacteria bacterium]|jgi:type VI secretion system protein ImpK|nr:type secretion protein DotU [Alphaproteobacteria bacterium]